MKTADRREGQGLADQPAPLLGRDRELTQLDSALEEARAGRGRLVVLAGEPGIGKTRLAEAAGRRAEARGFVVHWARPWEGGGAPAYWPWRQVVRAWSAQRDSGELDRELGMAGPWLAHLVPELRERLPTLAAPGELDSDQARFALFDALATFLRGVSRREPLLLIFDDIHAADEASLLALQFVTRSIQDAAIVVLATSQEPATHARPELQELLTDLATHSQRFVLGGLHEADLARLIEERGGVAPPAELVRTVWATTEGNPFFSDEIVQVLMAEGRLGDGSGGTSARLPLPRSVRDAIARRLAPLTAPSLEALTAAAVIGREFRLTTVERATGIDRELVLEVLDHTVAAGLVVGAPGGRGRFRFVHALIRETLYARLSTTERLRVHLAVGEALEQAHGASAEHLVELAHHFAEAAPVGDAAKALDYARRAGEQAMAVLAYEQAADMFELALETSELLEPDVGRRAELLLALGEACARADRASSRATLIAAAEAARAAGRADLLAQAGLSFRAFAISPGVADEALIGILEEALELADEEDGALRARLLPRLAVALYYSPGTEGRRAALVDEAVTLARRLDDPATLAYALTNGQLGTWGADTTERALEWSDELFRLTEQIGDVDLALATRNRSIDLLLELDDLPGVDIAIETLDRIATRHPDPRARAYVPLQRARRALVEGRFADAERLNAQAAALGGGLGDSMVSMLALAQTFGIRWSQRRLGELADGTRRFADGAPGMPVWRGALALVYCHLGREAEARRELERLAAGGFGQLPRDNVWLLAMALLSETCAELGDAPRAQALYELLAPFARRNVVSPHAIFAGPVARYLGLLAAAGERWDVAADHFAAASAAAVRQGARPFIALVAIDEARMLITRDAAGDRGRALELLEQAAAIAEELGSERVRDRAEELRSALDRSGMAPLPEEELGEATAPAAAPPGSASLRREGDVWAFDYQGEIVRVRDGKGVRHLAALLANPGVEIHAVELAGSGAAPVADTAAAAGLSARPAGAGDAGPALDSAAKTAYRRRLEDLREDLDEAESWGDPERAARARQEIDFLTEELAAAVGLGGRDRKQASAAERARVNVTRAIRSVVKRISEHHTLLGSELEATVRTGTFCAYEPDLRRPVRWTVDTR